MSGQTASALASVATTVDGPSTSGFIVAPEALPATVFDAPLTAGFVVAPEAPPGVPIEIVEAPQSTTLTALHVSFGALQFMDMLSTVRGLNAGLRESNPLMRGLAGNPAAMAAVKVAAGATTILLTRRMARKNRVASIITMAAVNGAYAVIVARNLRPVSTQ